MNCKICNKSISEGYYHEPRQVAYCSKNCLHKDISEKEYDKLCDDWVCYYRVFSKKEIIARLFEFDVTDFEEVYAIIDEEKKRLHLSIVNYSYNMTLDLTGDLMNQLKEWTRHGDTQFNETVRKVFGDIIGDLFGFE